LSNSGDSANKIISEEMKKRMTELEAQIALQNENMNKLSLNSNQKEEKLNNDITEYINQINDLKNELEVLNNIITNLTEEKENNTIKITNLLHENEKLKQNIKNNIERGTNAPNASDIYNNNKKYEEIILNLKKNMMNLKEENKKLEEVILKKESEVNKLSSKVNEVENILIKKEKELQDSIEYSSKLTCSINFHKNEILKIKQKQNDNNKIDKNSETITNMEKDLQNLKKNLEEKENKLNILSNNNKTLLDKYNKLTQVIKNELNCNNGNNSKYNNKNKNNICSSYNNYYSNKVSVSKPQSQLKNKTTRVSGEAINPIASNILPKKTIIKNNMESYKDNHRIIQKEKSPMHNRQNIEDKKLYIISKHKVKSKTPGKLISSKHKLVEPKPDLNRQNIEIMNKNSEKNIDDIYPNIYNKQKNTMNSKLNINEKYKQIESKYKNDIKEVTKEDTLFNEEDLNNLNIKKEIISPYIQIDEDTDSIPIFNNMNSQLLKSKKEGRNKISIMHKKNVIEQPSVISREKEFPVIESYCILMEKETQNKSNCMTNENNSSKNFSIFIDKDKTNESKIEAKQVQDLKERVNKILNEF
jgi:hypothetical protein